VIAGGSLLQLIQAALHGRRASSAGGKRTHIVSLTQNPADLLVLRGLLESGQVEPVIDRCYPLSDVAQAFRHYEKEHARGKIVISVAQPLR
jgi:NADPH:quinone reductase-like Zn-dependent oxidoreductase